MTAYDQRKLGQIVSAVRFRPQPHPYFIGKTGGKRTPFGHPVEPLGNEKKIWVSGRQGVMLRHAKIAVQSKTQRPRVALWYGRTSTWSTLSR